MGAWSRVVSVYNDFMGDNDQSQFPLYSTYCAMLSHADCDGTRRSRSRGVMPCECYCHDASSVLSRI